MTVAIYYHPEAYSTNGPKLMGRNAAGESFLKGFLLHSKTNEFWAQVDRPDHGQHFLQAVKEQGRAEQVKLIDKATISLLSYPGTLYYPGPAIGKQAYHRALVGLNSVVDSKQRSPHSAWSLCGVTHTTSSAGAMDSLVELITAPVQPWDAIICTSNAVKSNVHRLLQEQVNHLQHRLGMTKLIMPMLPVIPLGIHTQDFEYSEEQKLSAKLNLGVDKNTLVVLFMGRLSFHAKAHPLAMYLALQKAAIQIASTGKRIMLIECGWHANEYIEKAYLEAAKLACPLVKVVTLDGRSPKARAIAWAGADVFCSLSDNIQETFGIAPIEAMAAGLPVVVSDWDGYKDTVRDGVDGFRIPTCMPQIGLAKDLAIRHALEIDSYDMYCGHTCSLISVDIEATAKAFIQLFESEELRIRMGKDGKTRARQMFDWSVIIKQYENLWQQQTHLRLQAQNTTQVNEIQYPWPSRMDPFDSFGSYATHTLEPNSVLTLTDASIQEGMQKINQYKKLAMINFAKYIIPTDEEIAFVLGSIAKGPCLVQDLLREVEPSRQAFLYRSLVWFMKLGIVKCSFIHKSNAISIQ